MSLVTPDIVKHVAQLARLRLEGEALERFAGQVNEILGYVQRLQAVKTEGVEPTSHVLPLSNVLRKDEARPSLSQAAVAGLAPATHPPFIKVPKVLEAP